jgi:hypothetical protein
MIAMWTAAALAWNPDAGVIPSWTADATATATTNAADAGRVLDGDLNSQWTSGACFPTGFLSRDDLNPLAGACAAGRCSGATSAEDATDADFYTGAPVAASSGVAELRAELAAPEQVDEVAFRGFGATVTIAVERDDGTRVTLGTHTSADAYTLRRYPALDEPIRAVIVTASTGFTATELAAYRGPCVEAVTVDLGVERPVGVVKTRHWAGGKAISTTLLGSADGETWTPLADLDPAALAVIETRLPDEPSLRWLQVRHEVVPDDYAKVYVWEIDAWDADGEAGPLPAFTAATASLGSMLGVNGIWGWGNGDFSDRLADGAGPELYAPVAAHARNYHNLSWDVTDPDHVPRYDTMADSGTEAQPWLDWDREYGAWDAAGLDITASVQFSARTQPIAAWDDPYRAAYTYAEAMARHFGPTAGTGTITAIEAGNEPWDYPAPFYRQVLAGFVDGTHAGDPAVRALPGALQAHDPTVETADGGNYLGARVDEATAAGLDALNVHAYSWAADSAGYRRGVPPEIASSTAREVVNFVRWRDANLPGRPVWLTEWGWDSDGVGEACTGPECVTEVDQAAYAVRGALLWNRLGIERATWFFYANLDGCTTVFCRSGLTGTKATGFAPKRAFHALASLQSEIGDRRVVGVLSESDDAWVYLLGDAAGAVTHVVGWTPTVPEDGVTRTVTLPDLGRPVAAFTLTGIASDPPMPARGADGWTWTLSADPVVVEVDASDVPDDTDVADTDAADTDVADTDAADTDVADTDAAPAGGCGCAAGGAGGAGSMGSVGWMGVVLWVAGRRRVGRRSRCAAPA